MTCVFSCQKHVSKKESRINNNKTEASSYEDSVYHNQEKQINSLEHEKYLYRWKDNTDFPSLCIVIDDFGQIGGELLQGFCELDDEITFAVLPDLPNSAFTAKQANIYGHEVILHIPMQALDNTQHPGKKYIKSQMLENDIQNLINEWLEQIPQAIGANNHMGSKVTSEYETIRAILSTLGKKGLFFLDSKTSNSSIVLNAAKELKLDYIVRDIFLDVPDVSPNTITTKLKSLTKYRGRVEPIIIISHCHNQSKLEALRKFIEQIKGMGIHLITISDAIKMFNNPA